MSRNATPSQLSKPVGSARKLHETASIDHSNPELQLPTICWQPVFFSRYMHIDCIWGFFRHIPLVSFLHIKLAQYWDSGRNLTVGSKLFDRLGHKLTDELVKDSDALLIAGIFSGHLHIALRQNLFANFNAVNEGNKWNCSSRVECGPGKPRDAGSSPASSTIQKKSELLPSRERVRISSLYQRHYILSLCPPVLPCA